MRAHVAQLRFLGCSSRLLGPGAVRGATARLQLARPSYGVCRPLARSLRPRSSLLGSLARDQSRPPHTRTGRKNELKGHVATYRGTLPFARVQEGYRANERSNGGVAAIGVTHAYAKLPAADVERARRFYRDASGLEPYNDVHGHLY